MKKPLLALSFLSLLFPLSAQAASSKAAPLTFDSGSSYFSIGGGLVSIQNESASFSGDVAGSAQMHFKDGADINGKLGYHFNEFLAGEAEIGYLRADFDHISGTLTTGGDTFSGNIGVDGTASAFTGLLNGIVTPFQNLGFSPYFGGGIGFARTHAKINTLTFSDGSTTAVNSNDSSTNFAADGLAGFDVPISNAFSLGGRYQYLWINDSNTTTDSGVTTTSGNSRANIITAQATFKF
jgi:opacity protein-like surface antigen